MRNPRKTPRDAGSSGRGERTSESLSRSARSSRTQARATTSPRTRKIADTRRACEDVPGNGRAAACEREYQRAQEQARYRALVEVAGQIVWTTDATGSARIDASNGGMAGWCAFTGQRADEVDGWGWLAAIHPEDQAAAARSWVRAIAGRERYEAEYRLRRHDGVYRDFAVHGVPVLNAEGTLREWVGICVDITERTRGEAERAALLARERDVARHLRALQAVTETALAHLALDDLMPCLLDRLLEALDADHAVILLRDDGGATLSVRAERGISIEGTLRMRTPLGRGIAGQIAARREPVLIDDLNTVEVLNPHVRERISSLVGVPLLLDDAVTGVVLVGTVAHRHFTEDDARLLERAAERVGLAIGQARQYEAERHAREEAAARAAQLAAMIDSMADGVIVHDGEGRMLRANGAARDLLGLDVTPEVAAEHGVGRWTLRDARGRPLSEDRMPLFRVLRGETLTGPNAVDVTLTTHDGREVELSLSAAPVLDATQRPAGGVLIFRDVTERRHLERRTAEALQALLAMAEALVAPEGDRTPEGDREIVLDGHLRADTLDTADSADSADAVERLAELTRSVLGCQRVAMLSADTATHVVSLRAASGDATSLADAQLASSALLSLVTHLGELEWVRLRAGEPLLVDLPAACVSHGAAPTGNADAPEPLVPAAEASGRHVLVAPLRLRGELVGLLVIEDGESEHAHSAQEMALAAGVAQLAALVIERERLLREHAEAQASELALRVANQQMDDFLSMASHELRTPLTSVKAYVQVAQRRLRQVKSDAHAPEVAAQVASQVEAVQVPLERANAHSDVLNRLVGDLLDASRIQAHRLAMRLAPCELGRLVREVVEEQQLAWPGRSIETALPADEAGTLLLVEGDADRLKQVIANYLTNALKYAPADQPILVGLTDEGDGARVFVRDHGPGLSLDEQHRVWDRFHRSASVRTQNGADSGLGLGLYICRGIVELHGGMVGVESVPENGCTFSFTLPLQPVG